MAKGSRSSGALVTTGCDVNEGGRSPSFSYQRSPTPRPPGLMETMMSWSPSVSRSATKTPLAIGMFAAMTSGEDREPNTACANAGAGREAASRPTACVSRREDMSFSNSRCPCDTPSCGAATARMIHAAAMSTVRRVWASYVNLGNGGAAMPLQRDAPACVLACASHRSPAHINAHLRALKSFARRMMEVRRERAIATGNGKAPENSATQPASLGG